MLDNMIGEKSFYTSRVGDMLFLTVMNGTRLYPGLFQLIVTIVLFVYPLDAGAYLRTLVINPLSWQ